MNAVRRKKLAIIMEELEELKGSVEELLEEEEEYRDNMPENLQGSERYEKADEACDSLYEVVSNLEEAIDGIDTAME